MELVYNIEKLWAYDFTAWEIERNTGSFYNHNGFLALEDKFGFILDDTGEVIKQYY